MHTISMQISVPHIVASLEYKMMDAAESVLD